MLAIPSRPWLRLLALSALVANVLSADAVELEPHSFLLEADVEDEALAMLVMTTDTVAEPTIEPIRCNVEFDLLLSGTSVFNDEIILSTGTLTASASITQQSCSGSTFAYSFSVGTLAPVMVSDPWVDLTIYRDYFLGQTVTFQTIITVIGGSGDGMLFYEDRTMVIKSPTINPSLPSTSPGAQHTGGWHHTDGWHHTAGQHYTDGWQTGAYTDMATPTLTGMPPIQTDASLSQCTNTTMLANQNASLIYWGSAYIGYTSFERFGESFVFVEAQYTDQCSWLYLPTYAWKIDEVLVATSYSPFLDLTTLFGSYNGSHTLTVTAKFFNVNGVVAFSFYRATTFTIYQEEVSGTGTATATATAIATAVPPAAATLTPTNTTVTNATVTNATCSSKPITNATISYSGTAYLSTLTFKPYGTAVASIGAKFPNCTDAASYVYIWKINEVSFANTTLPFTDISSALPGFGGTSATLSVNILILNANGNPINSGYAATTFTVNIKSSALVASLSNAATAPAGVDLILDATSSVDPADVCYVSSLLGAASASSCYLKTGATGYTATPAGNFTYSCAFANGSACGIFSNKSSLTFTSSLPKLTISSTLLQVNQSYIVSVRFSRDQRSSVSDPLTITVARSAYVQITNINVAGGLSATYFVTTSALSLNPTVLSSSTSLNYTWTLRNTETGSIVNLNSSISTQSKSLTLPSNTLTAAAYTATLLVTLSNNKQVSATSTVDFVVVANLPSPVSCTISSNTGTALTSTFSVACVITSTIGTQRIYYSSSTGVNTLVGDLSSTFVLPATATSVFVQTELGSLTSGKVTMNVTINALVVTGNIGNALSSQLTTSSTPAQAAAVADTFLSLIASSSTTTSTGGTTTTTTVSVAVQQQFTAVISALTASVDVSKLDTNAAVSLVSTFSKVTSNAAAVTDDARSAVSASLLAITQVLLTSGGATTDVLLNVMTVAAQTTPTVADAGAATRYEQIMLAVATSAGNNLIPGASVVLTTSTRSMAISRFDPTETGPRRRAKRANLVRRSTACDYSLSDSTIATLAAIDSGSVILNTASCSTVNNFPVTSDQAYMVINGAASTLASNTFALTTTVNGVSLTDASLGQSGTAAIVQPVSIPYTLTPATLKKRDTTTTSYSEQCAWWDSANSAWSTSGCTTKTDSTGAATCSCSHVGTYAVLAKATTTTQTTTTTSATKTPTATPTVVAKAGHSSHHKGVVAGAVIGSLAGAAIIGAGAFYFLKK